MVKQTSIGDDQMRPALIALLSSAVILAGCAKKTTDISATYVSPLKYDNYLCSQLRDEATRVSRRTAEVFQEQNTKASVGAVAWAPRALIFGGAGASDEEVARLKGEMAAIGQASAARNCGVSFEKGGDSAVAPQYDGGRVTPDMKISNAGGSIYNLPPKSGAH